MVHVCLAVTCHLQYWENNRDFYMLLPWTRLRNKSQLRKVTLGTKIYPVAPAGTQIRDLFDHESGALTILSYSHSPSVLDLHKLASWQMVLV